MSDLRAVWQAHKTADRLSVALASYYEEDQHTGQQQLTNTQKQVLTREFPALTSSMGGLGMTGRST
ncbi:MAG: hypothetical protein JO362_19425 [Streptomycetaceae bacterium]|nr:hypothetical protein [Streptomycetaceae bacterium]